MHQEQFALSKENSTLKERCQTFQKTNVLYKIPFVWLIHIFWWIKDVDIVDKTATRYSGPVNGVHQDTVSLITVRIG